MRHIEGREFGHDHYSGHMHEPGSSNWDPHGDVRRMRGIEFNGANGAGGGAKKIDYYDLWKKYKEVKDEVDAGIEQKRPEYEALGAEVLKQAHERYINEKRLNIAPPNEKKNTAQFAVTVLKELREFDESHEFLNAVLDRVWSDWLNQIRLHYNDKRYRNPPAGEKTVQTILAQTELIKDDREAREFYRMHVFPVFEGLYSYGPLNKTYEVGLNFFDYVNGGYEMEAVQEEADLPTRIRDISQSGRERVVAIVREAVRSNMMLGLSEDLGVIAVDDFRRYAELARKRIGSVFRTTDRLRIDRYDKAHSSFKDALRMYSSGKEEYIDIQRIFTPSELVDFVNLTSLTYDISGLSDEEKFTKYALELERIMNDPPVGVEDIDGCIKVLIQRKGSAVGAHVARSLIETMISLPDFDPDRKDDDTDKNRQKYKIAHSIVDPKTPIKSVTIRGGFRARYTQGYWVERVPKNFDMIIPCFVPADKLQKWGFGSFKQVNWGTTNFFAMEEDEQRGLGQSVPLFDYINRVRAASATEIEIVKDLSFGIEPAAFLKKFPEYIRKLGFNNIDMYRWFVLAPLMHAATMENMATIRSNVLNTPFVVNRLENGVWNRSWTMWRNWVVGAPIMESAFQWSPRNYARHLAMEMLGTDMRMNDLLEECGFRPKKEGIVGAVKNSLTRTPSLPLMEGFETPFYLLESLLCESEEFRANPQAAVLDFCEYAGIRLEPGVSTFTLYQEGDRRRGYSGKIPDVENKIRTFLNKTSGTQGSRSVESPLPDVKNMMDFEGVWWIAATAMMQRSKHRWRGNSLRPWVKYANERIVPFFQPYLANLVRPAFAFLDRHHINGRDIPYFRDIYRYVESFFGQGYFGGSVRDWDAILNSMFTIRGESAPGLRVANPDDPLNIEAVRRIFAVVKLIPAEDGGWKKIDEKSPDYDDYVRRGMVVDGVEGYRGPNSCVPLEWILRGERVPSKYLDARKAALNGSEDVATRDISDVPFFGMGNVELLMMYHMSPHTFARNARHAILEIIDDRENDINEEKQNEVTFGIKMIRRNAGVWIRRNILRDATARYGAETAEEWFMSLPKHKALALIEKKMFESDSPDVTHRNVANLHTIYKALQHIKREKWLDEADLAEALLMFGVGGHIDTTRRDGERFEGIIENDRSRASRIGENDRELKSEAEDRRSWLDFFGSLTKHSVGYAIANSIVISTIRNIPMTSRTIFWGLTNAAAAYPLTFWAVEGAQMATSFLAHNLPMLSAVDATVGWFNPFWVAVGSGVLFFLRQQEFGESRLLNKNRARRENYVKKVGPHQWAHDADDEPAMDAAKAVVTYAEKYRDLRVELTTESK